MAYLYPSGPDIITIQPISNFTYTLNASTRTVNFTWTYLAKQAQFLSSGSGTVNIKTTNGKNLPVNLTRTVTLSSGSTSFTLPSVASGLWLYGELVFSVRGATNTLKTTNFGFNPFSVSVSNVTTTSAILQLSGDSLPSVSDTFNVYKVSDNSLVFTSPQTQLVSGRSVTATNLQPNTVYRAQFRRMVSPNFTTLPVPVLPVCTGVPTSIANSGTVTKKTNQTIPGVSGTFDVYDATTFCPAFYSSGGYTYQLPNNGDYILYGINFDFGGLNPSIWDVIQGSIGDCVLDAVMASAAHKIPDVIKSGIVPDPTALHTYFVRLYYKKINAPFWVRLTATLPMRDPLTSYDILPMSYDGSSSIQRPVIWSHLLMKAYCCMIDIFPDFLNYGKVRMGYNNLDGVDMLECSQAIFGEDPSVTMTYFDCNPSVGCLTNSMIDNYKNEINSTNMKNLMNSRDVIVIGGLPGRDVINSRICGSNKYNIKQLGGGAEAFQILNTDGTVTVKQCFVIGHEYSILEYRNSDNKVIVRNPWGGYSSCADALPAGGLWAVDYEEFVKIFVMQVTKRTPNPVMSNMQSLNWVNR